MLAAGVEYELSECAIVKFVIPPLELSDGRKIPLRKTNIVFPPFRALIVDDVDGGQIQATFDVTKAKWEIVPT